MRRDGDLLRESIGLLLGSVFINEVVGDPFFSGRRRRAVPNANLAETV